MSEARGRPPPFHPGTLLSRYYRVQALVRLSETRMYYLVDDDRPDQRTRRCWHCGDEDTPRTETACGACGLPFPDRTQFLLSVRWQRDGYQAYVDYYEKGLVHPGILTPEDVFHHEGLLCTVVPYHNEALMLDEGAPFSMERVLHLAQRFAGLTAFLHHHGVALGGIDRSSFLLRPDEDRVFLFDPNISMASDGPIPDNLRGQEARQISEWLGDYVPVNQHGLATFLLDATEGKHDSPMDYGRAVETLYEELTPTPVPAGLAALTDVGLCRLLNEDNWGWTELDEGAHLYVVADGMGGHEAGEVASSLATETLCKSARRRFDEAPAIAEEALENLLDEAFQEANNTVKQTAEDAGTDMGTTLVTALVRGRLALIANVGDSRAYLLRDGVLYQVSRDHSLVARMVDQGRITPEEARNHPHSNILLRTVGTERNVEIDIFRVDLEPGDRIMLCSDGLWGEVPDEEIEQIMNHYADARICARELLRAAHRGGGRDNITVVTVGVEEG